MPAQKPRRPRKPRPKPTPDSAPGSALPSSRDVVRDRRALELFLRDTKDFRLAIALHNDPLGRDEMVRTLGASLRPEGVQVLTLDLATHTAPTLLSAVEALLTQADPALRPAVMVINLETRVEYGPELVLNESPGNAFLRTANLHRDAFPDRCPAPLVLWMTELTERTFVHEAPDLWHWRSHIFDLRTRREPTASPLDPHGKPWDRHDHRLHPEIRLAKLEEELAAYRQSGDRRAEMRVLNSIGIARLDVGEAKLALKDFETTLTIARDLGDRRSEGTALGNLGLAHADLGDARRAIDFYEQQLVITREIGDRRGEGAALGNLGLAHADLGDARRAMDFYEQRLVIAREIGDRRGEGAALGNLGLAHADLGDVRRAIAFYEQQLVIAREIGDRRGEGNALGNLGNAHADLGDARRAMDFYEQRLVIAREIGDRRGEGIALWNGALRLRELGGVENRAEAIRRAEAALRIFEAIEDPNAASVRTALEQWRQEEA